MNDRTLLLNYLVEFFNYDSYLEIGVRNPADNFNLINIKNKDGVDPAGKCNFVMTSNEFFKINNKKYDLIFIDGLHTENQVVADFEYALKCLNKDGTIVLHDCNPPTEWHQREIYDGGAWNGTAWKAFVKLRMSRKDLFMCVVDTDWGLGVIKMGKQKIFDKGQINFKFLDSNRKELLNLMSMDEFHHLMENMRNRI
jgi:hypothetical protein